MRPFKQPHIILLIGVVITLLFSSTIKVYASGAFEGDEGDSSKVRWEQNISNMYKKLSLTP